MEFLRLTIALILPCIGGYFWLAAAEAKFDPEANRNIPRQWGYGLFIGYAAVHALVLLSAAVLDRVEFWPITIALFLISAMSPPELSP